ncbi:uncharacterized protein DS421_3g97490 [Arachis hypogaea]|nr:uncharacterized protein DS421_3g97490 [Arachis hypogaea]
MPRPQTSIYGHLQQLAPSASAQTNWNNSNIRILRRISPFTHAQMLSSSPNTSITNSLTSQLAFTFGYRYRK